MTKAKMIRLSLTLAAFALTQIGCATPQNTNITTTNANTAVAEATPDKAAITAEITRIENDWPRVLKEKDGAAVRQIEADDIVLVYPDGSSGNKEQDVKDIEAGALTFDSWEILDLKVNVLDNDAAVASFRIAVKNGKYKTANISGQYRVIDTFVKRNSKWQIVSSAATKLSPEAEKALMATPTASPTAAQSPGTKASPAMKAAKASPTRRTAPPAPATTP